MVDRNIVGRGSDERLDLGSRRSLGSTITLAPLGAKGPPPAAASWTPPPVPPPPTNGIVLRAVGNFPRPPEWTPAYLNAHWGKGGFEWFPMTPEWQAAIGGPSSVVGTADELLGLIAMSPARIARVNYMSHGDSEQIGLSGHYVGIPKNADDSGIEWEPDASKYYFQARRDDNDKEVSLPGEILFPYSQVWGTFGENGGKTVTLPGGLTTSLAQMRQKFTSDAVLWLYLCHVGSNPLLLQLVANTFQVRVGGFSQSFSTLIELPVPSTGIKVTGMFVLPDNVKKTNKLIDANKVTMPEQLDNSPFAFSVSPQPAPIPVKP